MERPTDRVHNTVYVSRLRVLPLYLNWVNKAVIARWYQVSEDKGMQYFAARYFVVKP